MKQTQDPTIIEKRCDFRIILSKDSTYRGETFTPQNCGDNKINVNINLEPERLFSETANSKRGKKSGEKHGKKHKKTTVTFCGLQVTSGPVRPATLGSASLTWKWSERFSVPTPKGHGPNAQNNGGFQAHGTRITSRSSCAKSVGPWDGMKRCKKPWLESGILSFLLPPGPRSS